MRFAPLPLLLAMVLGGCVNLAPDYQRPAAPVAGQWSTTTPAGQANADIAWRELFIDSRLRDTVAHALANNRDLWVAALNVEYQQAQYTGAGLGQALLETGEEAGLDLHSGWLDRRFDHRFGHHGFNSHDRRGYRSRHRLDHRRNHWRWRLDHDWCRCRCRCRCRCSFDDLRRRHDRFSNGCRWNGRHDMLGLDIFDQRHRLFSHRQLWPWRGGWSNLGSRLLAQRLAGRWRLDGNRGRFG